MENFVQIILVILFVITLMIASFMAKKGWIDLPVDAFGINLLGLSGGMLLFALIAGIYHAGLKGTIVCLGPVFIFLIFSFIIGNFYYKSRQGKESNVQTLDLEE